MLHEIGHSCKFDSTMSLHRITEEKSFSDLKEIKSAQTIWEWIYHDKEGPYLRFYFEYMFEYARVEVTKNKYHDYGYLNWHISGKQRSCQKKERE